MSRELGGLRVVITRMRLFNMEQAASPSSKAAGLLVCGLLAIICTLVGLVLITAAPLLVR